MRRFYLGYLLKLHKLRKFQLINIHILCSNKLDSVIQSLLLIVMYSRDDPLPPFRATRGSQTKRMMENSRTRSALNNNFKAAFGSYHRLNGNDGVARAAKHAGRPSRLPPSKTRQASFKTRCRTTNRQCTQISPLLSIHARQRCRTTAEQQNSRRIRGLLSNLGYHQHS